MTRRPVARWLGPRHGRRNARDLVAWAWRSGGLVILGGLATGMTAFPAGTATVLAPVREVTGAAWGGGLRGVELVRETGRAGVGGLRRLFASARRTELLERRVEALGRDAVLKEEQHRELIRLQRLLQLKQDLGGSTIAARVVGGDPGSGFGSLVLDVGAMDGLRAGAPVVAPAGAVGRILSAGADTAVALWIGDPRSRVAAYVQRSRVSGVLAGTGTGCELRYLAAGDDVRVGDRVLTAERGSVFPKGILIGVVKEVRAAGLLLTAEVAPAVRVSRLEEVLIIARPAPSSP